MERFAKLRRGIKVAAAEPNGLEDIPNFVTYSTPDVLEWERTRDKSQDYVWKEPNEEDMDWQGFPQTNGRDQGGNKW